MRSNGEKSVIFIHLPRLLGFKTNNEKDYLKYFFKYAEF